MEMEHISLSQETDLTLYPEQMRIQQVLSHMYTMERKMQNTSEILKYLKQEPKIW